jgi:hypothetical protein
MNDVAVSERVDQPLDSPRAGIGTPDGCNLVEGGVALRLVEVPIARTTPRDSNQE